MGPQPSAGPATGQDVLKGPAPLTAAERALLAPLAGAHRPPLPAKFEHPSQLCALAGRGLPLDELDATVRYWRVHRGRLHAVADCATASRAKSAVQPVQVDLRDPHTQEEFCAVCAEEIPPALAKRVNTYANIDRTLSFPATDPDPIAGTVTLAGVMGLATNVRYLNFRLTSSQLPAELEVLARAVLTWTRLSYAYKRARLDERPLAEAQAAALDLMCSGPPHVPARAVATRRGVARTMQPLPEVDARAFPALTGRGGAGQVVGSAAGPVFLAAWRAFRATVLAGGDQGAALAAVRSAVLDCADPPFDAAGVPLARPVDPSGCATGAATTVPGDTVPLDKVAAQAWRQRAAAELPVLVGGWWQACAAIVATAAPAGPRGEPSAWALVAIPATKLDRRTERLLWRYASSRARRRVSRTVLLACVPVPVAEWFRRFGRSGSGEAPATMWRLDGRVEKQVLQTAVTLWLESTPDTMPLPVDAVVTAADVLGKPVTVLD